MTALSHAQSALQNLRKSQAFQAMQPPARAHSHLGMCERDLLAAIKALTPPKPVPVPPTPVKAYWMGGKPGLWLTYGWQKNLWTAAELVAEAKVQGFEWIATQAEATTPAQAAAFCLACRNAGVTPGVWESAVDYGSPVKTSQGYDFYIGQVEGPGQFDRLYGSPVPAVPHAVVTNFGGLGEPVTVVATNLSSKLINLDYYCLVESHIKESPATPAAQVDYATRVLGWPAHMVSPMVGLGGGATLADYPGVQVFPGWSVFSAEYLP